MKFLPTIKHKIHDKDNGRCYPHTCYHEDCTGLNCVPPKVLIPWDARMGRRLETASLQMGLSEGSEAALSEGGPKHYRCPHKRQKKRDTEEKPRRDGGRDGTDVATYPGLPEAPRCCKRQEGVFPGACAGSSALSPWDLRAPPRPQILVSRA